MAKAIQVDGAVRLSEIETIAALRAKVKAYTTLFGAAPILLVEGWFTCAKSNDPVHLNRSRLAKVYPKTIRVDLGAEGEAHVGLSDIDKVTVWLCKQ